MNKLITVILCVIMMCVMLCACGQNGSVSDMASEAISDVATEAEEIISGDDGTVTDDDGYIGNETTSDFANSATCSTNETQNSTTSDTENNDNNDNGMM